MKPATDAQAKAAYLQFASEPNPEGFEETYPSWEKLEPSHKELWFRVATAALNGKVAE